MKPFRPAVIVDLGEGDLDVSVAVEVVGVVGSGAGVSGALVGFDLDILEVVLGTVFARCASPSVLLLGLGFANGVPLSLPLLPTVVRGSSGGRGPYDANGSGEG